MGKARQSANLVSDNNIFVNITNDRVGIGSISPKSKLDVVGDVNISGVITASSFSGNASSATYATYATTSGISTSVIGGIGSITQLQVTGVSTFTNGPVLVGSANSTGTTSQRLQITGGGYVSGNLGVGTTNPQYSLDVSGDINLSGTFRQNGSQFVASRWTSGTGNDIYRLSGDVGIGTTNPTSLLHVTGDVLITGVTTMGTLKVSSGIVTATSGVVTYYGDGSKLSGVGGQLDITSSLFI